MSNKKKLEQFILNNDNERFLYLDEEWTSNCYHYYKEKYNDRFYLLYERHYYNNRMDKSSYDFAGYYDCKDKVLYNSSYNLSKALENEEISISFSGLGVIDKKIDEDIKELLVKYALKHQNEFKDKYREEFLQQDKYYFERLHKDVETQFIESKELEKLADCNYYIWEGYTTTKDYKDTTIYTKYLDDPEAEIKKLTKEIISNNKEKIEKDMAFNLLENEYKNHYLSLIKDNVGKLYDDVYINRELLSAIKDVDAQNINITIQYGNDKLTFKYPKASLECDLKRGDTDSSGYNKAYEEVKEFLNKHKEEKDWHRGDFDFRNITSISYGRQILFEKNIEMEDEKNIEDDFEEMEK